MILTVLPKTSQDWKEWSCKKAHQNKTPPQPTVWSSLNTEKGPGYFPCLRLHLWPGPASSFLCLNLTSSLVLANNSTFLHRSASHLMLPWDSSITNCTLHFSERHWRWAPKLGFPNGRRHTYLGISHRNPRTLDIPSA